MIETEKALRKAINELLHIVRMNNYMKKAGAEFNGLLDSTDLAVEILEHASGSEKYSEAKNDFMQMSDKIKNTFGSSAVADVYNCFKIALDDEEFRKEVGVKTELASQEKSNIFRKLFDRIVAKAEQWDYEEDFYSYFLESVKELFMPTEELNTQPEDICPYCDGIPKMISKVEFFGPHSASSDGYVWGCECGAYADMDENGNVLGRLGDALLHQKRNLVRGAICELCKLAGLTVFESFRWFSLITGGKIEKLSDVEYLDVDKCNSAIRIFILKKQQFQSAKLKYPKDRSELFLFFADGGRLSVCNAYGFQYGKLLIPSEIGPEGIRIYGKEGSQSIAFSNTLRYEFKDEQLFIHHPSGKKEKYKMLPANMRTMLFETEGNDDSASIAG